MGRSLEVWVDEVLPAVHALTSAACADATVAEGISERVVLDGAPARTARAELENRAVALAVRSEPVAALAPMLPEDREAVALARLAKRSVPEIARALGVGEAEVKQRMLRGLRATAGELVGAAA
jgi:DNA-directed RNA polymerase specialized sigma24 family protein